VFFPADIAVGLTAIVHFLNNIFKLALLGKQAEMNVVLRFGIPALLSAFVGAELLVYVADLQPVGSVQLFSRTHDIMPVKLVIATLMVVFAVLEIMPGFERVQVSRRYLPVGGILSGFFGGLSGHQGALRSMFLVRAGLSKEQFIATGVVIACLIDVTRLTVYGGHAMEAGVQQNLLLLGAATVCAFLGAFIGNKLVKKVTLALIQRIVSVCLILIAVALGLGFI
jgi:uncharacterized membrane protein YfcA